MKHRWLDHTHPKTNSWHLSGSHPERKRRLPSIHFQVRAAVSFREGIPENGRIYRKVFVDLVAPVELALPKMYEDRMVARGYVVRSGQSQFWAGDIGIDDFCMIFWNTFRFRYVEIFSNNIVVIFGDSIFAESFYI